MAIRSFLAMTAAEFLSRTALPPNIAWMACHFSPYGTGLSNVPVSLPPGSLLIVNDRTPIRGHDPKSVEYQLRDFLEVCDCGGILLDFQRQNIPETAAMAVCLAKALPCPVAVSEGYAVGIDCPVFLSPLPHHIPLKEHLAPWQNREIWLEMALDSESIVLTEEGAEILPCSGDFPCGHRDEKLHCHYSVTVTPHRAEFILHRTQEDLQSLLEKAEALGVTTAVGLFQELWKSGETQ